MSVPQPSFGPNGFITPSESTQILPAVQADINAAFGGNLNMETEETPQGQLATSMAAAIGDSNDAFLFLSQQFDPLYNSGRYQDAVARIYYIERIPASATVVNVTCVGLAGVVIPVGALVIDAAGNQYSCLAAGKIPNAGSIILQFACTVLGPTPCPAGSITTIYQAINGWDTASNLTDGVIGANVETSQAFEQRRALSVAQNSQGSVASILGAILNVAGVLDAFVTENVSQVPTTIRGYTLNPNSVYAAVVGGLDSAVAQALWSKKSPGCGYNGTDTQTVQDTQSGYNPPYPSYQVSFVRPTSVTVCFIVTISNSVNVPANAVSLVQNAIVTAFAGGDGGPRARIGDTLLASRYYSPIQALGSWAQIVNIKLGCSNEPASQFTGSISGTTLTVSATTAGIITVGQQVIGAAVAPGTIITANAGANTWTVSISQTVASGSMQGVNSASDEIPISINQSPVTALGNTQLVLF